MSFAPSTKKSWRGIPGNNVLNMPIIWLKYTIHFSSRLPGRNPILEALPTGIMGRVMIIWSTSLAKYASAAASHAKIVFRVPATPSTATSSKARRAS